MPLPPLAALFVEPAFARGYGRILASIALLLLLVNAGPMGWGRAAELPDGPPPFRIAVLGDSLAAGYGLPPRESFPTRLQAALQRDGYRVLVENAGVSGDTSAGGLSRLDWLLATEPDAMIVELGGNDALRGLDPAALRSNLDRILTRLRTHGIPVLLAGMRAPRNLGAEYADAFDSVYPHLAVKHEVPLYPFFLEGVAGVPRLNQSDGIHPNAKGVDVIVQGILPMVASLVDKHSEGR